VVIASTLRDQHARYVADLLGRRSVPFVFFDTGRFPEQLALTFDPVGVAQVYACCIGGERVQFEGVRSIWWRRPRHPTVAA
jgi:hypothetical protein